MYKFENLLQIKHPANNNIKPKIRQQLQILRDKGFIEFLGNGKYRKVDFEG
jgi:type II restriction enzyme